MSQAGSAKRSAGRKLARSRRARIIARSASAETLGTSVRGGAMVAGDSGGPADAVLKDEKVIAAYLGTGKKH